MLRPGLIREPRGRLIRVFVFESVDSCQAKRAALFAEKLAAEILPPVSYRHWTFTIPKAIGGLFERERRPGPPFPRRLLSLDYESD